MAERFNIDACDKIHEDLTDRLVEHGEEFDSIVDAYVAFKNMMETTKANGSYRTVDIDIGLKQAMLQLMLDVATSAGLTVKVYKKPEYMK